MKDIFRVARMWRPRSELKKRYDVVIIGGGSHGLATAYYLAKTHGITNVAVLEKSYIGSGASGRNTTIVRSNYRTPEGAEFYGRSVKLYERLSAELDLRELPAVGSIARGTTAVIERISDTQDRGERFRLYVPQELGHFAAEVALDMAKGLAE